MEVTDPELTDLDPTSELEPATELEPAAELEPADDGQSVLLNIDAASQVARVCVELGVVSVEGGETWDHEERRVAQFAADGCSCNLGPNGSPCNKLLSVI